MALEAAARDAVWVDVLPSMRSFGSELAKGAGEEADKQGKATGQRYGKAMLAGVAVVAGGAALAAKALYGIGETFDEVTDTIRTGTGATGQDLDKLVDSAKRVGQNVPAEYEKIGSTIADVNTRLGLTGPTLEKFSSQVLEVGRMTGEELDLSSVTAGLNAFGIEGEDSTEMLDHLWRVSQATGISMNDLAKQVQSNAPAVQALGFSYEDTANMVGALDKAGLNSSKMMAGMSRGLVELAKDGEEPADAFKRITGEIGDLIAEGDKAGAVELASKVFGTRNASQFVGAIESGAMALDDLAGAVGATDDTILQAGEETMDFAEQWRIFQNDVMVLVEPAASALFSTLGDGMEWVQQTGIPTLKDFGSWLKDNKATMAALAVTVGVAVIAFGGMAIVGVVTGWLKAARGAVLALNAAMRANPIGVVITVIGLLVAALIYLYQNNETARRIMDAAWQKIKGAISAVVNWFKDTAWPWMRDTFTSLSNKAGDVKDLVVRAWNGIRDGISSGWDTVKRIFDRFKDGLESVKEKFGRVKEGIAQVWGTIGAAIANPINKVIDSVNNFTKNLGDKLSKIPGVSLSIPSIPHVPVPSAPAGGARGRVGGYAAGGVLPGYSPGRDNMHFYSPEHGWLDLAGGEPIMRPEFGVAVGHEWIHQMNAAARAGGVSGVRRALGMRQAYAGGGIIAGARNLWSSGVDMLGDLWSNGKDFVGRLIRSLLPDFGGSWVGKAVKGILTNLDFSKIGSAIREKASLEGLDGAGGGGAVGPAIGWRAIWGIVRSLFPDAILTSAVRNSTVAGYGVKSLHATGRAIDFALNPWSRMVTATKVLSQLARWTELIHTPAGMWQQNRGVRTANFLPITKANHINHVHAAMASGGIWDPSKAFVADSGVLLRRGLNLVDNRTGGPEPLRRADLPTDLSDETIAELRDVFKDAVEVAVRGARRDDRGSDRPW